MRKHGVRAENRKIMVEDFIQRQMILAVEKRREYRSGYFKMLTAFKESISKTLRPGELIIFDAGKRG